MFAATFTVTRHSSGKDAVVYEFRRSAVPTVVPLDLSESYRMGATLENTPWRAVGLGLLLGVPTYAVGTLVSSPVGAKLLGFGWLVAVLVLCAVEIVNRRDVLTGTAIVRQSGILGKKTRVIPLQSVTSATYAYPRFGESWDVGDIEVRTSSETIVLGYVKSPAVGAQRILDAKGRLESTG